MAKGTVQTNHPGAKRPGGETQHPGGGPKGDHVSPANAGVPNQK